MKNEIGHPFDCGYGLTGGIAGREPELEWLLSRLNEGAHMLLSGPEGIGKSTLAMHAASLAQRSSTLLCRLDLARHANFEQLAQTLRGAVENGVLNSQVSSCLGDPLQSVRKYNTASEPNHLFSAQGAGQLLNELLRLDDLAESRGKTAHVILDSMQHIPPFVGADPHSFLQRAMERLRRVVLLVCDTHGSSPAVDGSGNGSRQGQTSLQQKAVDRIDPRSLAAWIDQRMTAAGVLAEGVGDLCVLLGGPQTREVMDLARKTFELAREVGLATATTVRRAMDQAARLRAGEHAATWQSLGSAEQRLVGALAAKRGGDPIPLAAAMDAFSLGHLTEYKAEYTLIRKGLVTKLPSGELYVSSASFSHWAAQAHVTDKKISFASTANTRGRASQPERRPSAGRGFSAF